MKINKVKTAIKIGDFQLNKIESANHITVKYNEKIEKCILKCNLGRVYLFTCNENIIKIGGSSSKGGIKTTLSFYTTSMTGSPGKARFIIHLLIRDELLKGNKCEIFMITSPLAISYVSGLFKQKKMKIAAFKEMEDFCKEDYYKLENKYPVWNFQENNDPYPQRYSIEHVKYHEKRLKKN
jgi:hypothetical protein